MEPVVFHTRPALRRPVLVLAFSGWNDAGQSATTAVRLLSEQFGASKLASLEPEEFYDFAADPSGLHNLIADPKCQAQIAQARKDLLLWMERTQDPLLDSFRSRSSPKPQP